MVGEDALISLREATGEGGGWFWTEGDGEMDWLDEFRRGWSRKRKSRSVSRMELHSAMNRS